MATVMIRPAPITVVGPTVTVIKTALTQISVTITTVNGTVWGRPPRGHPTLLELSVMSLKLAKVQKVVTIVTIKLEAASPGTKGRLPVVPSALRLRKRSMLAPKKITTFVMTTKFSVNSPLTAVRPSI